LREERVAEPIQVLFVEDSPDDVDLMLRELQRAGYEPQWRRVDTEAAMRAALAQSTGDIAVIDYSMPHFDAPAALALLAKMAPYLPGVVVSGTVGEDVAVATMQAGAVDYVLKDNLRRFAPTVERAMRLAAARREQRAAEQARIESETLLQTAANALLEALIVYDDQRRILFVNQRGLSVIGLKLGDVVGRRDEDLIPAPAAALTVPIIAQVVATGRPLATEVTLDLPNLGAGRMIAATYAPVLGATGGVEKVIVLANDVTERRQAQAAARLMQARFRALFDESPVGVFTFDDQLHLVECNDSEVRGSSVRREQMVGADLRASGDQSLVPALEAALRGERGFYEGPYQPTVRGGGRRWVSLYTAPLNDEHGAAVGGMAIEVDLSEYKRSEETIELLAFRDMLTDLPNRTLFIDRLRQAVAAAQRSGGTLAVAALDLDRFKSVNELLGHAAGDQLLKGVGERLRAVLREGDTVAHSGSDDFLVLLPSNSGRQRLVVVADKMMEQFHEPWALAGETVYIGASLGLAVYPDDGATAETLLERAYTAMRRAKGSGGNTYQLFEESLDAPAVKGLRSEMELHRALEAGQFVLHYQPEVDLRTGEIVGAEALVRWQHPERGLLPPSEFISLAEATGLIVPLGDWIMREACRQAARWQSLCDRPLFVAVNLSPRQFREHDLSARIKAALLAAGLRPTLLQIEITESLAMDDSEYAVATLHDLNSGGMGSALDDFGTGYSSLSLLKSLPLRAVKIDRSFISGSPTERASAAIVRAVVAIGHELGLTVVAEGVETAAELAFVQAQQCDLAQGFLFSRPLPVEALTALLRVHPRLLPAEPQ
jgi:diguanylate cyclase (GGDEF)-like protein/PAS domain S-box-containing protein